MMLGDQLHSKRVIDGHLSHISNFVKCCMSPFACNVVAMLQDMFATGVMPAIVSKSVFCLQNSCGH